MSFCMCGALLAFLMYNFPPAKIFMGDSGSTIIGLMASVLAIKFVEIPSMQTDLFVQSTPAIAFGFLLIPLLDVLRVFAIRIYKKQSPLSPDRNHLHHLLQNKGLTHTEVTITLLTSQFLFAGLCLLMRNLNVNLAVSIQFFSLFQFCFYIKTIYSSAQKLHIVRDEVGEEIMSDLKVYPIYSDKEKRSIRKDS